MYLVHVLRDFVQGRLMKHASINELPRGLFGYYQRHWRTMRSTDPEHFRRAQRPVLCLLAISREPVSVRELSAWANIDIGQASEVVLDWRAFLNEAEARYRLYHTSFADFLNAQEDLRHYHDIIALRALSKITGFGFPDDS